MQLLADVPFRTTCKTLCAKQPRPSRQWQKTCFRSVLSAPFCKTCGFYRSGGEGAPITRSRLQVLVQIPRRRQTSAHFSRVTVKPFNFMVSFLSPAQLNMGLRQKGGSSSAKGERQELAATLRTFGKPFPPWMLTILWSPPKSLQVSASSPPHKLNLNVLISWS